eukprot:CAMPEP_0185501774 /NCGR_PEP_ID=MMETSP1366-20130426/27032_1 /TAXON_ID=38817 /ORGANISM="Gephyrocapsa oceanica, Strain RCC1303" /LENGTH=30 /DNA_ID= /DNA_START= /DNA_END= /DNA_ORIENTATION=
MSHLVLDWRQHLQRALIGISASNGDDSCGA